MGKGIELVDWANPLYIKQDRFVNKVIEVANRHAYKGHEIGLIQSFHDPLCILGACEYKYIFSCNSGNKIIDSITLYIDFKRMTESMAHISGVYIATEFEKGNRVV